MRLPPGAAVALLVLAAACEHAPVAPSARDAVTAVTIGNPIRELMVGQTWCFRADVVAGPRARSGGGVTWRTRHGARNGALGDDGCYEADSVGADTITAVSLADTTRTSSVGVGIVPGPAWPEGALEDLTFPTYDGSGQAVHPSEVALCKAGPRRWRFHTAVTPYPALRAAYENPSVFVSSDGRHWVVQPGTSNPLVLPGTEATTPAVGRARYYTGFMGSNWGTLSDPDLVCDADAHRLRLYFRQVDGGGEYVFLMENRGDSVWTQPQTVMVAHPDQGGVLISPSVARWQGQWRAWFVQGQCGAPASSVVTGASSDGRTWVGKLGAVDIVQPGYVVWHLQVRAFGGALWMLYSAYPALAGHCFEGDLFLARSDDGQSWATYGRPLLDHNDWPDFEAGLYRSSMVYDSAGDLLTLQLSGFHHATAGLESATRTIRLLFRDVLGRLGPVARPKPSPALHPQLRVRAVGLPFGDGEGAGPAGGD